MKKYPQTLEELVAKYSTGKSIEELLQDKELKFKVETIDIKTPKVKLFSEFYPN